MRSDRATVADPSSFSLSPLTSSPSPFPGVTAMASALVLGAAALLAAGCAAPVAEAPPAAPPVAVPAAEPVAAPVPAAAPAPAAPVAVRVPDDGTVARFTGTASDLPAGTAALLDLLARDKSALWEIKGYSDRQANKPEPARDAALARALSVRKQLVLRGVPPQNLRVKYSTEEAREAVTVLPQGAVAAALPSAAALSPMAPAAQALPPQKYEAAKAAAAPKAAARKAVKEKDKKKEKRKDRKPAAPRAKPAPAKPAAAAHSGKDKAAARKPAHPAPKKPASASNG